jgi:hypothetical protein
MSRKKNVFLGAHNFGSMYPASHSPWESEKDRRKKGVGEGNYLQPRGIRLITPTTSFTIGAVGPHKNIAIVASFRNFGTLGFRISETNPEIARCL